MEHTPEPEYPLSVVSNLANLIVADLTDIMPLGTDECDSMQEDIDAAICKAAKIIEHIAIMPNARLIVAAPDLLAALNLYIKLDNDHRAGCELEPEDWAECHQAGTTAIAKATQK